MTTAHRHFLACAAALWLGALAASPALAHASLVGSTPADGATVAAASLTAITLTFDDELDASKSKLDVVDTGSSAIAATGSVGADLRTMVATGLSLAPGDYEARWTAVATDGDLTRGVVGFHVTAGSGASAATPAGFGPSVSAPANPDVGPADVVVPVVAAGTIVAVVGAYVLRRSRTA